MPNLPDYEIFNDEIFNDERGYFIESYKKCLIDKKLSKSINFVQDNLVFSKKNVLLEQGYLSSNLNDWIIRIRFNGKNYKIALKKHIKNFTNYEFEYLIPNSDGEKIMSNITNIIKKERFFLEIENKNWIIDCFKEKNFRLKLPKLNFLMKLRNSIIPIFYQKKLLE